MRKKKGYVAVLLAVLIPIIISTFYLYVRYDGIDSEQTALSIATRDAALAAVSNYSTGVLVDRNNDDKNDIDFDSQKQYIFRKAVDAFNSTIVAKRGLNSNVIPLETKTIKGQQTGSTSAAHSIYRYFFVTGKYRLHDLNNQLGPEYPNYTDVCKSYIEWFYIFGSYKYTDQKRANVKLQVPEYNVSHNKISSNKDEISIKKDTSDNTLLITTKIQAKTGDIDVDKRKIITQYRATPAKCNADIILAIPTNHAAFTAENSIAYSIDYENSPIYAIKHSLRRFVKNFMFYDGIRFGVIPYSGKVSVDKDNCSWAGKLNKFGGRNNWPTGTTAEIPVSYSYYVCGSCGEDIKNNESKTLLNNEPIIGLMANENFFGNIKGGNGLFLEQPVDICYGGDISLYSMKCKKNTKFYPNPFPILPLTANTYDVFSYLLLLNPYEYTDSPDKNLSNFLFLPFSIANLMFKEKITVGQQNTSRKKIMIMIANQPDFFAPREMTFLGFDNDACSIPMIDGERLNFEEYYKNPESATLTYKDGEFYNKVIDNTELKNYRENTRITVAGPLIPTRADKYTVMSPAQIPVRIAVKNIFTIQVVSDNVHGSISSANTTFLANSRQRLIENNTLELDFDDVGKDEVTLKINTEAKLQTPVIAKLNVHGVCLESMSSDYIIAIDDNEYSSDGSSRSGNYSVYLCSKTNATLKNDTIIKLKVTPTGSTRYPILSYAVVNGTGYLLSGKESESITPQYSSFKCSRKYNAKIHAKCNETWSEEKTIFTERTQKLEIDAPKKQTATNCKSSAAACGRNRGVGHIPLITIINKNAEITSIEINKVNASNYLYDTCKDLHFGLFVSQPSKLGDDFCKNILYEKSIYKNAPYGPLELETKDASPFGHFQEVYSGSKRFEIESQDAKKRHLVYLTLNNGRGYHEIKELTVHYRIPTTTTSKWNESKESSCDQTNCSTQHSFCTNKSSRTHSRSITMTNISKGSSSILAEIAGDFGMKVKTGNSTASVGGKKCVVNGMHVFFVPQQKNGNGVRNISIEISGCKLLSVEACNNLVYTKNKSTQQIEAFETKLNNLDVIKESIDLSSGQSVSDNEIITCQNNQITIHKDSFDQKNGKLTITLKKKNPTIDKKEFSKNDLKNLNGNNGDYELKQNSQFSYIDSEPSFGGADLNYYWCTGYKYKYADVSLKNPFIHKEWCWKFCFYVICDWYWVATRVSSAGAENYECIADGSLFTAKIKYGWVSECYIPLEVTIGGKSVYNESYCHLRGYTQTVSFKGVPGELVASSKKNATGSHLAKDLSIKAEITNGRTSGCKGLKFNKWPSGFGGNFSKLYANVTIHQSSFNINSKSSDLKSEMETFEYVFSDDAAKSNSKAIKINGNDGKFSISLKNAEIIAIAYEGDAPVMYDKKTGPSHNARWIDFGRNVGENTYGKPYMDSSIWNSFGSASISEQVSSDCIDCLNKCDDIENCDCRETCGVATAKEALEKFGISKDQLDKNACNVNCSKDGMENPCKEVDVCNGNVCSNHQYKTKENWGSALKNFDEKYKAVLDARKNLGEISGYEVNNVWSDSIDTDIKDRFTISEDYTLVKTTDEKLTTYMQARNTYEMNVEAYGRMQQKEDVGTIEESLGEGEVKGEKEDSSNISIAYKIPEYCSNIDKNEIENKNELGEACKQKVEDDLIVNKVAYYKLIPGLENETNALEKAISDLNTAEENLEKHLAKGNGVYLTYDTGEKDISAISPFEDARKETDQYVGGVLGVLDYLKYTTQETIAVPDTSSTSVGQTQETIAVPDASSTSVGQTQETIAVPDASSTSVGQTQQTITKTLFVYPKNTNETLPSNVTTGIDQVYYTMADKFITGIFSCSEVIIPENEEGKKLYKEAYYRAPALKDKENLIGSVVCGKEISFSTEDKSVTTGNINIAGGYIDPCINIEGEKDADSILCPDSCTGVVKDYHDAVIKASEALSQAENAADEKYEQLKMALEKADEALGTIDDVWDDEKGDNGNTAFARLKHYGVELSLVDEYDDGKKNWYSESCEDGLHNPETLKYPADTKVAICPDKCSKRQNSDDYNKALAAYNEAEASYRNAKNIAKLYKQKTEIDEYAYNTTTCYFETSTDKNNNGFNMALFPLYGTADITVLLENRYEKQLNKISYSYDATDEKNFKYYDYLNGLNNFFLPYYSENATNAFVGPSSVELVNDDGAWLRIHRQSTRLVFAEFTNPINRIFERQKWQLVNEDAVRKVTESHTNVLANNVLPEVSAAVQSNIDKVYFIVYNNANQLEYVKEKLKEFNDKNKIVYKTAKDQLELEKVLDEIAKEIEVESPTAERIQ